MAGEKKQSVLNGAMVLAFGVILVKIIGVFFKIPFTDMVGSVGRGYFNSAYEIYTPIFAISMAGLPVAVARLIAENVALEKYREVESVFKVAKKLFLVVGFVGTAVLALIAYPYCKYYADIRNLPAIFCIAPAVFFCCLMSAYRGYYEGLRNMKPTAMSQVIEATGKLCVGLVLAYVFVWIGERQFAAGMAASGDTVATVFGVEVTSRTQANNDAIYPWAAAGAVLGVTMGSVLSTLSLIIYHKVKGQAFDRVQLVNSPAATPDKELVRTMISIAVPMVVSSLILNVTNLIDTTTIQARIATAIEADYNYIFNMYAPSINAAVAADRLDLSDNANLVKYLWGAYGSALDFRNLIPTITVQLGVSALPALAAAWAIKDKENCKSTVETVLRVAMMIALPAGFGMAVLAQPILTILYGRGENSDAIAIIVPIMAAYGIATGLMAVSTPITNMLQAIGRTDIPVKSVIVGAIVKVACNYILVGNPRFNIYGAVIGTVLFYVVIVSFNLVSLLRISKVRPQWLSVIVKPFVSAVLCAAAAYATNGLLCKVLPAGDPTGILNGSTFAAVVSIGVAVVVYAVSMILCKGLVKDDIISLPKGKKIAKALEKYRLLG